MPQADGFSFGGFLVRVAAGVALVLATYNPTGWSYVGWLIGRGEGDAPLLALAGVVLLILYVVFLRSTWAAMGALGVVLAGALIAALLWVLVDAGILSLDGAAATQWAVLIGLGVVMGIGLSWAHVRRALSGQASVDDVER
jgi:hypothetical protein